MASFVLIVIRDSLYKLARLVYDNTVREYLPYKLGLAYNVPIRDNKIFDFNNINHYRKFEMLEYLERTTYPGDKVLIIGGGLGMAPVVCGKRVLPDGKVIVYEGAKKQCERTRKTINLNKVEEYIKIEHSIVGEDLNVKGSNLGEQTQLHSLPSSDKWVIDIEGGELGLLDELSNNEENIPLPKEIIIESHPSNGASYNEIETRLDQLETIKEIETICPSDKTSHVDGKFVIARFK